LEQNKEFGLGASSILIIVPYKYNSKNKENNLYRNIAIRALKELKQDFIDYTIDDNRRLDYLTNQVRIVSFHSSRGLESNFSIVLGFEELRLFALKEMFESGEELPNILWIIQGEEEIEGKTPFEVIPKQYLDFGAKIYLEETGMYKDEMPLILFLPKNEKHPEFLDDLNQSIYMGQASFENRKLNKFSECPFLINIPEDSYYLAFGPNDSMCNIHKENESLDKQKLINHQKTFKEFIHWIYTNNYA